MSGRTHIVSGALYGLSALLQNQLMSSEQAQSFASLLQQSIQDETAYSELLYRIKITELELENTYSKQRDYENATRLWRAFREAVEGAQQ